MFLFLGTRLLFWKCVESFLFLFLGEGRVNSFNKKVRFLGFFFENMVKVYLLKSMLSKSIAFEEYFVKFVCRNMTKYGNGSN